MKFFNQYAESIDRITIYPLISLFIFVIFFIVLIVYVKKMDKNKVEEIRNLPLADESPVLTGNNLKQA
jgi:cytochrome c oxidase cbb3-type subunit 4